MGINLLPSQIYNKISAGEVVERPSSVVKELVENSIDGGATQISIEVLEGGIKKIIVTDNGCGIEPEDVEKAFLPHATSKISTEDDLVSIASLGFRGEALASISAVSKVELVSKTENNDYGTMLKIEGGIFGEKHEVGASTGTRITVADLFFNTPARLKFLKKPKSEEHEITNLVEKFILGNPNLSFRYIVDNKIVYNTFGNGLAEAMYIVYGKETYDNLLEINYKRDDVVITGYIARPTFCKPNRTYQTLFVNGRVVSNYMVSSAVQDALESFIMKGKFPLFALNITLPYDQVDVNVHPSKQEVKFAYSNKIYGIVNTAIYKAVSNANYIQETKVENEEIQQVSKLENTEKYINPNYNKKLFELIANKSKENVNSTVTLKNSDSTLDKIFAEKFVENVEQKIQENNNKIEEKITEKINLSQIKLEEVEIISEKTENNEKTQEKQTENLQQNKIEEVFNNYKVVGVLFETYILVEKENSLYIIDQHAAHERQLFDKFMVEVKDNEVSVQQLLIPYVFEVNLKEKEFIDANLETLKEFGIDISEFGQNTFKVFAVPTMLSQINLKEFFSAVLEDVGGTMKRTTEFVKDKIARTACRAAVKAGDKLSNDEINVLFNNFKENNNVLLCPHGRPIMLKFSKTEIEKWFKRIV